VSYGVNWDEGVIGENVTRMVESGNEQKKTDSRKARASDQWGRKE
jgi:hypothetical protein